MKNELYLNLLKSCNISIAILYKYLEPKLRYLRVSRRGSLARLNETRRVEFDLKLCASQQNTICLFGLNNSYDYKFIKCEETICMRYY